MFNADRIAGDFSRAATVYDAYAGLQHHVRRQLLSRAQFTPGARVLDVGCGTGGFARENGKYDVTQIDLAHMMCAEALRHAPCLQGDAAYLPFADHAFDAVFSSLMLQWVPEAYRELKRVVKPGGTLAVATFAAGTLHELEASFAAVDAHPHVSPFIANLPGGSRETITEYYPDLHSLMRHLKILGARNKRADARKSLMTPRQMRAVENTYRKNFPCAQGLPVTWNILYSVTRA